MDLSLKKANNLLEKYPQLRKTAEYLLKMQNQDGSYPTLNPDPIYSMYFLGIMNELNVKPNENTVKWVRSLQTGKRGFGETTGENSWDYTTFWGSEMHKFLGIKPNFEKDFVGFVRLHQNNDGGFGSVLGDKSNLISTLNWSISLINLGFKPNDIDGLCNYLMGFLRSPVNLDLAKIHSILEIFKKMGKNIDEQTKRAIIFKMKRISINIPNFMMETESIFHYLSILELLGKKDKNFDVEKLLRFQNEDGGFGSFSSKVSTPQLTYYSIKLIKMLKPSLLNEKIAGKIADYARKNELKGGGFLNSNHRNTHMAYCCVSALNILGLEPLKKELLISWIKNCQKKDGGFGYTPNSGSSEKATYWALEILKILNSLNIIDKESLVRFLFEQVSDINPFKTYYILGSLSILDILPQNYKEIMDELLKYQTFEGGFAPIKNGEAEMYETFRAVSTIDFLEKLLKRRGIKQNWKTIIKKSVVDWVLSCENNVGGFSWIPGEKPYVQPTYHATEVLNLLGKKINSKHSEWVLQFQNKDGGFNGGEVGTLADIHFSFWGIKILKTFIYQ